MCAHAVRVAVQKLPGVTEVEVSLNEGLAAVRFEAAHETTIARVREVIRSNGFTPREAEVRIAGTVVEHEGRPALAVGGGAVPYRLVLPAGVEGELPAPGTRVVVEARAPETGKDAPEPVALVVSGIGGS